MSRKATGALIAARRKELQMTQQHLADRLDVTNKAVSKWENGDGLPDISLLIPLSRILEVSADALLLGKMEEVHTSQKEEAESEGAEGILPSILESQMPEKDNPSKQKPLPMAIAFGFVMYFFISSIGRHAAEIAVSFLLPTEQPTRIEFLALPFMLAWLLFWGVTAWLFTRKIAGKRRHAELFAGISVVFGLLNCIFALRTSMGMGLSEGVLPLFFGLHFLISAIKPGHIAARVFYFIACAVMAVVLILVIGRLAGSLTLGEQIVIINRGITLVFMAVFWAVFGKAEKIY